MRKIIFVLVAVLAVATSCKTSKKAQKVETEEPTQEEVVVVEDDKPVSEVKVKKTVKESTPEPEAPILVRTEEIKVANQEDKSKGSFAFYVIMGSFSKEENANRLKSDLESKGFTGVILQAENSFYRVGVDATNSEEDARKQIKYVRANFPEHKDVWLLKRK
jgi:cell division protein FtsN